MKYVKTIPLSCGEILEKKKKRIMTNRFIRQLYSYSCERENVHIGTGTLKEADLR